MRQFQQKLMQVIPGAVLIALALSCTRLETPNQGSGDLPAYDRAGFAITVPAEVNRIVSMAPAITFTLIDLGLGDSIIAMDNHSALYLGTAKDIPVFDMLMPDAEKIASIKPDIILASDMSMMGNAANDPFALLKKLGICVAYIPSSKNIAGIREDLLFIAGITGKTAEGEILAAEMDRELAEIAALINGRASGKRVYFEISALPFMYSFGTGVYQHEMIEAAGGENIFSSYKSWIPVEAESVVSANPDVIFTSVDYIDDPVGEILSRPGWKDINAIKNRRVYFLEPALSSLPNHYVIKGIRAMMECLN